jgi:hypothetical protein
MAVIGALLLAGVLVLAQGEGTAFAGSTWRTISPAS